MAYQENPKHSPEVHHLLTAMQHITNTENLPFVLSDAHTCYRVTKPLYYVGHGKSLVVGNEHRQIVDFVKIVRDIHKPALPLTIVNFDLHIDDAPYTSQQIKPQTLNASWQRYFIDIGLTTPDRSYNIYPPGEEVMQLSTYTQEVAFAQSSAILESLSAVDILSIDLDFFNVVRSDHQLREILSILRGYSTKAVSTLFFTSPTTSLHLVSPAVVSTLLKNRL